MPRRDDIERQREQGSSTGVDLVELHIFIPLDLYAYITGIDEGAPKKSPVTHSLCQLPTTKVVGLSLAV